MTKLTYKLTTSDPKEILEAIKTELIRRKHNEQSRSAGARTVRDSARSAGAIRTYEEIITFISDLEITEK